MSTFFNDIKFGIRQLIKLPGFTCVAILTLALGIGACTAMFSLVNAVLLRPLPFENPERLVWVQNNMEGDTLSHWTLRVDNFLDYRTQTQSFADMGAYHAFFETRRYSLVGAGDPLRLRGIQISQNLLDVLGIELALGRCFSEEECAWEGDPAVILSHSLWRQKFGGDPAIIGRSVTLNDKSVAIVGVMPASASLDVLFGPNIRADILLSLPLTEEMNRRGSQLFGIGRLKVGANIAQVRKELAVIDTRLQNRAVQRGDEHYGAQATLLNDHIRGSFRSAFMLLAGAVLCVLMIACINLSNLLLARAQAKRREFSVRIALGAGRWDLARQTLSESLILAGAGCVLGVLAASLITNALTRLQVFNIPLLQTASLETKTLVVTITLACCSALLCSLLPILQVWRRHPNEVMHESSTRTSAGTGAIWIRRTLVVSEIALSYVLLVGAGLLTRSFVKVLQVDLGFAPEHTVSVRVDTKYLPLPERIAYYDRLVEQVAAVPGIESVGLSDTQPLGFKRAWSVEVSGNPDERRNRSFGYLRVVDHHYLQTLRVGLLAGRYFDERDTPESQKTMIVSETMARNLWPDQNPLGQTVRTSRHEYTVVGVVADVTHGLEEAPQPDMYLNMHHTRDWATPELVVRAQRDPALFIPDVRGAIKAFDPMLASNEFTTLEQIVDRAIAPRRLFTGILNSFSMFALLLAALGLYGVIAYSVSRRTQEIGIRIALGAQRDNVLRMVIGEGLRLAAIAIVIGLACALGMTRVIQSQLYGVTACDPFTYAFAAISLVFVTLLACYIPALRATKIDPMEALRYE